MRKKEVRSNCWQFVCDKAYPDNYFNPKLPFAVESYAGLPEMCYKMGITTVNKSKEPEMSVAANNISTRHH